MTVTRSFVVTGGARGVGAAIVDALLARGDAVVSLDLADVDLTGSEQVGSERVGSGRAGPAAVQVVGDASDPSAVRRAVDEATSFGPLTGWVNNAAIFRDADLHTAPDDVVRLVQANLVPAILGSAAAIESFLASGTPGAILNISSHQGQRAVAGALAYATAKAAIEGLTRATAVDYGPHGIRANAVALGTVATDRYERDMRELAADARAARSAELSRLHPTGGPGRVGDIAAVAAFLLSDAAAFVNGAVIPVDGGRAARGDDPEERRV